MSYAKQLKKQKKKKAREKKAKQLTTKVQNPIKEGSLNSRSKNKEKIKKLLDSKVRLTTIEEREENWRKQLKSVEVGEMPMADSVSLYYTKDIVEKNIKLFAKMVTEEGFIDINQVKRTAHAGNVSLKEILPEMFETMEFFCIMPVIAKINKEEGRQDINEKYIQILNRQLSEILEERITLDTLEEFLKYNASKIPSIFELCFGINKPTSEQDLEKINKEYAKNNDKLKDLNKIAQENELERDLIKQELLDFKHSMTEKYPNYINKFREKYLTNNYDLKFDLYTNKNPKEKEEFIEDMKNFFLANILVEEDSTNMKLKYYHEGNKDLYDNIGKEIGIDIESFINKCEYSLKHELRDYMLPHGALSQIDLKLKYEPVDPITWDQLNEVNYQKEILNRSEYLFEKFKNVNFVNEVYEALSSDLYRLKEYKHKVSFEDVLNNSIFFKVRSMFYSLKHDYERNIIDDPKFEKVVNDINYLEIAKEIVAEVKNKRIRNMDKEDITFTHIFEKEGFEELLIKKVKAKLETYHSNIEDKIDYYRQLIADKENVVERVNEFMKYRLFKNHGKWNDPEKSKYVSSPDYYDIEGFKLDYKKVIELLDLKSDSEVLNEIDNIIDTNIKAIESYNEQTKENLYIPHKELV